MKAISLWQPWASLIGRGKSIETRSWSTSHRGRIAIHAAKRFTAEEVDICQNLPSFYNALKAEFGQFTPTGTFTRMMLPLGAIVATANLIECVHTDIVKAEHLLLGDIPAPDTYALIGSRYLYLTKTEREFGNYQPGRWAWLFKDIKILPKPIPYKGAQGLFEIPDSILEGYAL